MRASKSGALSIDARPAGSGGFLASNDWLIWQLADSALPTGGFAHSGGLEAAGRGGHVGGSNLEEYCAAQLRLLANGIAPLAMMVHRDLARLLEAEGLCDLFLNHPVANRSSRAQGRALLTAARQIYPAHLMEGLRDSLLSARSPRHLPVIFGAVCRLLEIPEAQTARLLLFINLRGTISAAVRLGIVGPLGGQTLQHRLATSCDELVEEALATEPEQVAQTAPIADLFAACHDRLYSRLFQS